MDAGSHFTASLKTNTHVHLLGCEGVVTPSFDTSSPFTSCLYRLMTCVRLSLACKISAESREKAQQESGFQIWNEAGSMKCLWVEKWLHKQLHDTLTKSWRQHTYLRLHHYPLYHLLIGTVWASSFHSAGKDPEHRHMLKTSERWKQSYETVSAASFNVLSCAHFNELLVALGAALLAVALQQLVQQADTLLHLLDGVHPLWNLFHTLLVLGKEW